MSMDNEVLSTCEVNIMRAIWKAEGDISIPDLTEVLRTEYGKDYARTTVVTFLLRLSNKRFVSTYRKGRLSYAHAEVTENEYKTKLAAREADFWFQGMLSNFVAAFCKERKLEKEDADRIREIINGLDDTSK